MKNQMTGRELRTARQSKGMTQKEFATFLSVSRPTVTAWEQETNPVPNWVAEKLQSHGLKLNPKLDYETFSKAQEKARAEGVSFDEWVANLIKNSLLLALPHFGLQLL